MVLWPRNKGKNVIVKPPTRPDYSGRIVAYRPENPGQWEAMYMVQTNNNQLIASPARWTYLLSPLTPPQSPSGSAKEGGRIPKSGLYRLHKGEVVVPAYKVKVVDAALKKSGKKSLKKKCKTCVMSSAQLKKRNVSTKKM